jgi:hypothetical protein
LKKILLLCATAPFFIWTCALHASAAENWTTYVNARFGYSIEHPDIYTDAEEPENGDGLWLSAGEDMYALTLSGGYNVLGDDGKSRLRSRLDEVSHIVSAPDESGPGWYRLIYSDDGGRDGNERLFHEYAKIDDEHWATFIIVYPLEEKVRFAPIIERMEESLRLPPPGENGDAPLRMDAFMLRDGRAYKDGEALECDVYETPKGLDNGIAAWVAVGPETSGAVSEAETGVWFFGTEGEFVTFIPLESEYEYRDILWSPAGDRLVLVRGSPARPDVFFDVYAEGMEKQAEFSGLRGEIAWLDDGMRFVFTRIDDIREGAAVRGVSYGLKLSAVMYDSAVKETIPLKESSDTKSYSFRSFLEDGERITILEISVPSPKDWKDEEKEIRERELRVPIPAAG